MLLYSTEIFSSAGFSNQTSTILTIGKTLTIVIASLAFTSLVNQLNKKMVILVGLVLCFIYGVLLAIFGQFPEVQVLNVASAVLVYLFSFTANFGMFQLPLLSVMMIKPKYRAVCNNFILSMGWGSFFLGSFSFPYLDQAFGRYSFLFFAGLAILGVIYVCFRYVNPDGKSLDEIETIFEKRRFYI